MNTNIQADIEQEHAILQTNSGKHERLSLWALDKLELNLPLRILNTHCLGGANLARLLIKFPSAKVFGIDSSPLARALSSEMTSFGIKDKRCEVLDATIQKLPFEDEIFDLVASFETLAQDPNFIDGLREVHRTLTHSGVFLLCFDYNEALNVDVFKSAVPPELESHLLSCGFKSCQCFMHDSESWIAILAQKS